MSTLVWIFIAFDGVERIFSQDTTGYTFFAIGFALMAFGLNSSLNVEHSRQTDEILKYTTGKSNELKYKDSLLLGEIIVISGAILLFGVLVLIANIYAGIIICIFDVGYIIYNYFEIRMTKKPKDIEFLSNCVLNQILRRK